MDTVASEHSVDLIKPATAPRDRMNEMHHGFPLLDLGSAGETGIKFITRCCCKNGVTFYLAWKRPGADVCFYFNNCITKVGGETSTGEMQRLRSCIALHLHHGRHTGKKYDGFVRRKMGAHPGFMKGGGASAGE